MLWGSHLPMTPSCCSFRTPPFRYAVSREPILHLRRSLVRLLQFCIMEQMATYGQRLPGEPMLVGAFQVGVLWQT